MTRHSSRPDHWTMPRPVQDASMRYRTHGPIRPQDYGINPRKELIGGAVCLLLVGAFLFGLAVML